MQILRNACRWNWHIKALLIVVICFGLVEVNRPAVAQDVVSQTSAPELGDGLQGMQFSGPLAVAGETDPPEDILSFENGKFSSKACHEYGFTSAPYWVRRDANGLHFFAELKSPENGTMRFEGVFDGKKLRATALWTKERWYWTIEQKFHFTGRPRGQTGEGRRT